MSDKIEIFGKILRNLRIFTQAQKIGFEYILNPETGELHRVNSDFLDSHNLHIANLENFVGLVNVGLIQIHRLPDGTNVPVFDLDTGDQIDVYSINRCKHCRWW